MFFYFQSSLVIRQIKTLLFWGVAWHSCAQLCNLRLQYLPFVAFFRLKICIFFGAILVYLYFCARIKYYNDNMKTMTHRMQAAILIVCGSLSTAAQNVRGTVTDAISGEPLIGATVRISELEGVGAVTDIDGNYHLDLGKAGRYTVECRYVGYEPSVLKEQLRINVERIDEYRGILHTRRHLAASPVFKGIPDFRQTRIAMLRATKVDELIAIIDQAHERLQEL